MQGLKLPVMIVAFAAVFGLAVLGDALLHGRSVAAPLVAELEGAPGVAAVHLAGRGDAAEVTVTLAADADLASLYPAIVAAVDRHLGSAPIRLVDARNELLQALSGTLRFIIEEGIATGQFTAMASRVAEQVAQADGVTCRLQIDSDNVYLHLRVDDAYLYEVIPRRPAADRA